MNVADYRRTLNARQAALSAQIDQRVREVLFADEQLSCARQKLHTVRGMAEGIGQALADLDLHETASSTTAAAPDMTGRKAS